MKDHSPIRVFIGYDRHETAACTALTHSIQERASRPVSITQINLAQLSDIYHRPVESLASTEFSFSRFLVPYLCDYQGWAIFMDCDMLCRTDIAELWDTRDPNYAVQVVKHDHKPANTVKFNDNVQTRYAKKNWSSVMLMNCSECTNLSLDYVNSASGLELHQFKWLADDSRIGELPHGWNHLVDYDLYSVEANLVHFTEGGPYFSQYRHVDYADEWFACFDRMTGVIDKSSTLTAPQSPLIHQDVAPTTSQGVNPVT